jgi:hypothetical protein
MGVCLVPCCGILHGSSLGGGYLFSGDLFGSSLKRRLPCGGVLDGRCLGSSGFGYVSLLGRIRFVLIGES